MLSLFKQGSVVICSKEIVKTPMIHFLSSYGFQSSAMSTLFVQVARVKWVSQTYSASSTSEKGDFRILFYKSAGFHHSKRQQCLLFAMLRGHFYISCAIWSDLSKTLASSESSLVFSPLLPLFHYVPLLELPK
jgi:hypothetical protein